jgi:hypothetical protein
MEKALEEVYEDIVEVYPNSFLTSEVDVGERTTPRCDSFSSRQGTQVPT